MVITVYGRASLVLVASGFSYDVVCDSFHHNVRDFE